MRQFNTNPSTTCSKLIASGLIMLGFIIFPNLTKAGGGSCGSGGFIESGSSTVLNPNGDSYMSRTAGAWTGSTEEYIEFEELAVGAGGANVAWSPLSGNEPTGVNTTNDVASGGNCGNTDITTDANGGNDYSYYTIVDPDEIANNGDEYLVLALRVADKINGAFTFSFLVDADNNCGTDLNSTCGNPCFEYEIQLNTQTHSVAVISIDGCAGSGDCDALNGPGTPNGTDAYVCNPCNADALQVCAGSSECVSGSPVFWMYYVRFAQMSMLNATDAFTLVPASTTSPNSVIYNGTQVSDFGGIGDPNDGSECDCATVCAGSSCADCEQDCAFVCAAGGNNINFPVELIDFSGEYRQGAIQLTWATANELNNSHFIIEKAQNGRDFTQLATVGGAGTSTQTLTYNYTDMQPYEDINYYRLKQVDFDGSYSYSSILTVTTRGFGTTMTVNTDYGQSEINVAISSAEAGSGRLQVLNAAGQMLYATDLEIISGTRNINIPLPNLTSGIYFVRLVDEARQEVRHAKFLAMSN